MNSNKHMVICENEMIRISKCTAQPFGGYRALK